MGGPACGALSARDTWMRRNAIGQSIAAGSRKKEKEKLVKSLAKEGEKKANEKTLTPEAKDEAKKEETKKANGN